jgi:hypothetical protein
MAPAGQIVRNKRLTGGTSAFLIVTGLNFHATRKHEDDLTCRGLMPALIQSGRQLDERTAGEGHALDCLSIPPAGLSRYWLRGTSIFLKSRATVFGSMESD